MNPFEEELRAALRREEPPSGFARRVISAAPAPVYGRRNGWLVGAVAACLIAGFGSFEYRQYEGRKAGRELRQALQITESKLNIAQRRVQDLSRKTIHD
jgi:hypothetical protein